MAKKTPERKSKLLAPETSERITKLESKLAKLKAGENDGAVKRSYSLSPRAFKLLTKRAKAVKVEGAVNLSRTLDTLIITHLT